MELGTDHQSLEPGQCHFKEVICQALFCASRWEYKVQEVRLQLPRISIIHR